MRLYVRAWIMFHACGVLGYCLVWLWDRVARVPRYSFFELVHYLLLGTPVSQNLPLPLVSLKALYQSSARAVHARCLADQRGARIKENNGA